MVELNFDSVFTFEPHLKNFRQILMNVNSGQDIVCSIFVPARGLEKYVFEKGKLEVRESKISNLATLDDLDAFDSDVAEELKTVSVNKGFYSPFLNSDVMFGSVKSEVPVYSLGAVSANGCLNLSFRNHRLVGSEDISYEDLRSKWFLDTSRSSFFTQKLAVLELGYFQKLKDVSISPSQIVAAIETFSKDSFPFDRYFSGKSSELFYFKDGRLKMKSVSSGS